MILLASLLILLFAGGTGLLLFLLVRHLDPMRQTEGKGTQSRDAIAQDFLPFEDIRSGMIILPGHCCRAVIECSSINYDLKTEGEREQIEMAFQQFLNSLSFPVSIFLQTREIDNTGRIEKLREEISRTLVQFPGMEPYARQFLQDMEHLNERIGNTQQKKRFIIVPYDDAVTMEKLSDRDKEDYAARELRNRCSMLRSGLDATGVLTRVLDTEEVVELIYSCCNRDNFSYAKAIASGDAFSLFVDGEEDRFRDMDKTDFLRCLLRDGLSRIRSGSLDTLPEGEELMEHLKALQRKLDSGEEEVPEEQADTSDGIQGKEQRE